MWRVFGPAEQGGGIAHSKTRAGEIDRQPLVDETTYGGGGTTAPRRHAHAGDRFEPKSAIQKKDQ